MQAELDNQAVLECEVYTKTTPPSLAQVQWPTSLNAKAALAAVCSIAWLGGLDFAHYRLVANNEVVHFHGDTCTLRRVLAAIEPLSPNNIAALSIRGTWFGMYWLRSPGEPFQHQPLPVVGMGAQVWDELALRQFINLTAGDDLKTAQNQLVPRVLSFITEGV
jgi:hypothetical protein